ncbi:MAG TPA: ParA family protein [Ktedonobacteraceae bacterium]|jgi:chromosome partitioning protein|nr:ParA family protein [Ktedonobacteraceae bacterium]
MPVKKRTRVWTFLIRKGGSGKTTSAVNFATILACMHNRKVCLIDLDPQGNSTTHLGINPEILPTSVNTLFTEIGVDPHSVVQPVLFTVSNKGYSIGVIPAKRDLDETDLSMKATQVGLLKPIIDALSEDCDDIVIDTRPTRSMLTISALIPATHAIIPMEAGVFALDALKDTEQDINNVRQGLNPGLKLVGILPTRVRESTNLSRVILGEAAKGFDHLLMRYQEKGESRLLLIHDSVRLGEAPAYGLPGIAYDPKSPAVQDYIKFTEVLHAQET